MKRSARLERIKGLNADKEQEEARALAQARQSLEQNQQRLEQLREFRRQYGEQMNQVGHHGMSMSQVQDYSRFLNGIDRAIAEQEAATLRLREAFEQQKRQWLAARNRVKAMGTLVDKALASETAASDKRQQKDLDDMATQRFLRKNS